MIIHNIKITNFKSIYGSQYFDFDKCQGLVKLSGPIGAGKTTIAEALLVGLFGSVNDQRNPDLTAWNMRNFSIEMNLTSKNKEVHIMRNMNGSPLTVEVNGRTIAASNKRDMQSILEEEIYDVPKMAVIKMCIISFNEFGSLAKMSPGETKQFLDNVFGFKLFTDYNNVAISERKNEMNESIKLKSVYDDTLEQIEKLKEKKLIQQQELNTNIDTVALGQQRQEYINKGIELKKEKTNIETERQQVANSYNTEISEITKKMHGIASLGKQVKKQYETLKSGICPTCGANISEHTINDFKNEINKYAEEYKEQEAEKNKITQEYNEKMETYVPIIQNYDNEMADLRRKIQLIDGQITLYNNNLKLINENFDDLIFDAEEKAKTINEKLSHCNVEIGQWNDMCELLTKTLRFNLIERLIPSVNKSIQYFMDKLEQPFSIKFDQEFKTHIMVDSFDKEIRYANLSTGQKKSLDLAIIFGILKNVISGVNFNILVLDELFSNMDANARNTMLALLKDSMSDNKSIFVINHAEMNDDFFNHKIRVSLINKKIIPDTRGAEPIIVKTSQYEQIF